ncbi:aminotransferase class IV family protein [Streptomyces luteolifulvus]|uniref:Aminotransferase class IV family protein n=1 Tax=Streptomyces luteolifulvus TaxID=2615112 RepID=A0A6H9UQD6_9ACTN|nr:aminotransferase class IV family protein [Streptomyces luteolifulvus]KAB1140229.1 aminotransferase class IV family protein [Streptomyces luteolifulvus]
MAKLNEQPATAEDLLPLALTSYGHFTSMRVDVNHRIRGLSLHMERLVRDSRIVFGTPVDTSRVRDLVAKALEGRGGPCVVRVTHFDPTVDMGHPEEATQPQIMVTVRPAGELPPPPIAAMSVQYERDLPEVKHCGLFGALHARREARLKGFDDALFFSPDNHVSEGGTWNVGFIDENGTVVWPEGPVLPGVTAALLQERTEYKVAPVALDEAKAMPVAFATNTSIGIRALSAIDGTPMAVEHPVLSVLRETYLSVPGEEL